MTSRLLDPPTTTRSPDADAACRAFHALVDAELACAERDDLAVLVRDARRVRGFVDTFLVRVAQRGRELEQRERRQVPPAPDTPPRPAQTPRERGRDDANLVGLLMSSGLQSTRDARELGARSAVCTQFPGLQAALARGDISAGHVDALARQVRHLAEVEICELRSREPEIVRAACREFVDPFARWLRNVILEIREAFRPDGDADELTRQQAMSEVKTYVEDTTGMHVTVIKLDPLRDHELQLALRAHLNRLRQDPTNAKLSTQQLKVAAFITAVTAPHTDITPPPAADERAERPPRHARTRTRVTRPAPQPTSVSPGHRDGLEGTGTGARRPAAEPSDSAPKPACGPEPNSAVEMTANDPSTDTATPSHTVQARPGARRRGRVPRPVRSMTVTSRVPKMLIVVDLRTLISGPHERTVAELSNGTPVPLATIRDLLPDSDLVPILLSGKGQPLWAGRTRRLANSAQRDVLTALYRTCARPSCDTPVDHTQAHHADRTWEHHGNTNIDELVPLCPRDHDAIHHGGHRIHIADNHATITWHRPDGSIESHTHGGNRTPPPR